MPTYCFKNVDTGAKTQFIWSISQMERECCGEQYKDPDGVVWERDFEEEHSGVSGTCSNWPMKRDACGVHPLDSGKASNASVKMGVPTRCDKKTGQAIFESRGHRAKYLKARGFNDRNGGYGDG